MPYLLTHLQPLCKSEVNTAFTMFATHLHRVCIIFAHEQMWVNPIFRAVILSVRQFQLENTVFTSGVNFRGKNFAVIFIWGNLFLRIAEKIAKIRTHKISCPKVTAYALLDFTKCIRNNFKLKVLLFSASTDSREILSIKFSREWNIENDKKAEGKNNNRSVHWV